MKAILTLIGILYFGASSVKAFEMCFYPNSTYRETCFDPYSSIGFCCTVLEVEGCCYYTPFYRLWCNRILLYFYKICFQVLSHFNHYVAHICFGEDFWTPLILFIVFVTFCVCACRLCASKAASSKTSSNVNISRSAVERQAVVVTTPGFAYQASSDQIRIQNETQQPPSYSEVQQYQSDAIQAYHSKSSSENSAQRVDSSSSSSSENDN